jgi:hypothetical protein
MSVRMYAVAVIPPLIGFRGWELDSGDRARLDFGPLPRDHPAHGLTLCLTLGAGARRRCPFAASTGHGPGAGLAGVAGPQCRRQGRGDRTGDDPLTITGVLGPGARGSAGRLDVTACRNSRASPR